MFNQLLSTQTFQDHANEPSFGRKACFWILLCMGILAVFALCLVAFGPVATGKSVSSLTLEIIKAGVTLCGLFYGAAQVSKGLAQMGGNKGQLSIAPTTPPTIGAVSVAPMTTPITPAPPPTPSAERPAD